MNSVNTVPPALARLLGELPSAAVAFSGGVDSSYLLYAAKACGVEVRAYYVSSQFQPAFEREDARRMAAELGVEMTIIPLDALSGEAVRANRADRCYHCKQNVFGHILNASQADGYSVLMDGSNASDDAADRPGMRALAELSVRFPLREAGLTKDMVRAHSREAGLFTWDKPAYACLATRVPTGTPLDSSLLSRVEGAEATLFAMGFTDFRARVLGQAAKLQFPAEQLPLAAQRHAELARALSPWFSEVLLDLNPR